ncbi:hypothetical protein F2Q68_00015308 [Brassica cretica]|uniref:Aspartic peptidase DDI1-type domain-containing protein n=1 Tax=Brassica cretica TaxID=69181 RepID=A0A8S9HGF0_BRACR|nr:hypothetical protein F2Q68_00015308 [Brassica cretica]
MPNSNRSNKEKSLFFTDSALLEHTIRKEKRSTSIDNNIHSSADSSRQTSTNTPNLSNDSCGLPPVNTSTRTLIDIRPRDMVATLILERDENGDLHDHEGHLRIAAGQRLDDQRAVILDQDDDIAAAVQDNLISTSETPIDNISEKSEDAAELMQVDQDTMGRTLRKRKEKVPKHMKKGANDKEMESFRKRILRIPLDKPFEEAYFTHMLWMFFTETKETEEDIRRMFHQVREKIRQRITLKTKSDTKFFLIPCLIGCIDYPSALSDTGSSVSTLSKVMADHLGLKIELLKDSFTFVDCSQRNSGGFIRNLETNKLCLTLIDPTVYYDLVRVVKKQTGYKEIGDNPKFIAACHCNHEADEESITTKHELSINEKFVATIDNDHANEINDFLEGSINSWENDYYQPCFAVNTATPSKMKMSAMEHDEYDDG